MADDVAILRLLELSKTLFDRVVSATGGCDPFYTYFTDIGNYGIRPEFVL